MLLRIEAPHFVAGVETRLTFTSGEQVSRAAPIIKYMKGWNVSRVYEYCEKKGWNLRVLLSGGDK